TLTEGKPQVTSIVETGGISKVDLLLLVAAVERLSEHPIATAIARSAEQQQLKLPSAENFQSFTGKGVTAEVSGRGVAVGTARFLDEQQIDTQPVILQAETLRQQGQTVVLAAVDGKAAGLLAVSDPIKTSARDTLQKLRESKLDLVMLTGDNRATAA